MLDEDSITSASISEAVEKIPTDEKDYRKCTLMCFTLYSHSIQRALCTATGPTLANIETVAYLLGCIQCS